MRTLEDYRVLTGSEKAAILFMAIDEKHVTKLFGNMDDDEIKEISQTMSGLGMVSASLVERLFVEFAEQVSSSGSLMGTYESTERLLGKTLDSDRVKAIMEEIRGPAGRTMWDKLANVNEVLLANYLKKEHPQTVAVVLSKIKPDHTARVLSSLPDNFAIEVIQRILKMRVVQKEVIDDVERTLRTEFMSSLARTSRRDPHEMIADVFNNFDRNSEAKFMEALEERNATSAELIKSLMFTFEDLVQLDTRGIQTLLRNVEKDRLAVALKGASDGLRDLFFQNMSERAGKILQEDMEALGPVRLRDVDEAQMEMVTAAKQLSASGEIIINENKEGDELIY